MGLKSAAVGAGAGAAAGSAGGWLGAGIGAIGGFLSGLFGGGGSSAKAPPSTNWQLQGAGFNAQIPQVQQDQPAMNPIQLSPNPNLYDLSNISQAAKQNAMKRYMNPSQDPWSQ